MPTQIDTSPVTHELTRLISQGSSEQALLSAVAHLFPDISSADLSAAIQDAVEEAQRRALRKH